MLRVNSKGSDLTVGSGFQRLLRLRVLTLTLYWLAGCVAVSAAHANTAAVAQPVSSDALEAEAQLVRVYQLIGQAKNKEALAHAEKLIAHYPNFQLGQLIYGDLLMQHRKPLGMFGDVPPSLMTQTVQVIPSPATNAQAQRAANGEPLVVQPVLTPSVVLDNLREESALRLQALRARPPAGHIPEQFLRLPATSKHAIAVDASKARLYLFENTGKQLKLMRDFYISVGKLGTDKRQEGDQRTPLGVYFITSTVEGRRLPNFYGGGALPINYPNVLDQRLGRTGSGIWLHGTPNGQFSRAPRASDGCVVMSNPDLEQLIRTVQIRSTPVVIADRITWQPPSALGSAQQAFELSFEAWRSARSQGTLDRIMSFYSGSFNNNGKTVNDMREVFEQEVRAYKDKNASLSVKDLSLIRSPAFAIDSKEVMVVTFGEVRAGARAGVVKRQYWQRERGFWKIVYEGQLG